MKIKFEPNATQRWILGVDIGGTKIATLLVDSHAAVHSTLTLPTDISSPQATLESIENAIHQTLRSAGVPLASLSAIGLGIPGQVNSRTGVVKHAVNLRWHDVAAGELLSTRLGVPCFLENDVRAATLGVHRFYNRQSAHNLAYVSIGTGIAAGLIIEGELYRGSHGMAGEIGHIQVDVDGPRCACGGRGCLETLAAGPAIARMARERVAAGAGSSLSSVAGPLTARDVYAAAAQGDALARSITKIAGTQLARALHLLIMAYDVECIVLGGGVAQGGAAFLQPVLDEWQERRAESTLAQMMLKTDLLHLLPATFHAGVWGAVAVATNGLPALSFKHHSPSIANVAFVPPVASP